MFKAFKSGLKTTENLFIIINFRFCLDETCEKTTEHSSRSASIHMKLKTYTLQRDTIGNRLTIFFALQDILDELPPDHTSGQDLFV